MEPPITCQVDLCDELLACLADEEVALEGLLFKLREQHLVLASGEHRWLERTTAEVIAALDLLDAAGHRREAPAAALNVALGLPGDSKLGVVADTVSDEATCQRIIQRRQSLRNVLDQVRRTSRQNKELLASNLAATGDALSVLGMTPTYDATGRSLPRLSRMLDTRA